VFALFSLPFWCGHPPQTPRLTPYTIHPAPHTQHPAPYTIHPALHTPHPAPLTPHSTPYTPHPTPHTVHLHPIPCTNASYPAPHTLHSTPHTLYLASHTMHLHSTPFTLQPISTPTRRRGRQPSRSRPASIRNWAVMGGINHCSLHCRLAKFRGLMIRVKYGAVIGRGTRYFVCAQLQFPDWVLFSQSHHRI
jgi:hypothetical protein